MKAKSKFIALLFAIVVALILPAIAFADTIKLKDGSIIKGKVVGFKDQQFIVLIGGGARRSQLQLYIEDVESIEFDNSDQATTAVSGNVQTATPQTGGDERSAANRGGASSQQSNPQNSAPAPARNNTQSQAKPTNSNSGESSPASNSQPVQSTSAPIPNPTRNGRFFSFSVKVLADATANGWTNTGIVVRRGQRIRISASGRVSLGGGRFSTPAGVGSLADGQRLMLTEPTGALIAVIGDDNNDFIFIGSKREFVAQRDGTLFLGINEGNLDDNSGAFDATVEAEANDNTAKR